MILLEGNSSLHSLNYTEANMINVIIMLSLTNTAILIVAQLERGISSIFYAITLPKRLR